MMLLSLRNLTRSQLKWHFKRCLPEVKLAMILVAAILIGHGCHLGKHDEDDELCLQPLQAQLQPLTSTENQSK
jgi:hypothetical protein